MIRNYVLLNGQKIYNFLPETCVSINISIDNSLREISIES